MVQRYNQTSEKHEIYFNVFHSECDCMNLYEFLSSNTTWCKINSLHLLLIEGFYRRYIPVKNQFGRDEIKPQINM